MPLIETSTFRPPRWLRGAHAQTCWPTLFRRPGPVQAARIEISTPDADALEADWWRSDPPAPRVLILSHGLEGSSRSKYIIGLARAARREGWDALAWNYRGCGWRSNRQLRAYHSGDTTDFRVVLAWAATRYNEIALAGFSVGGNVTLRYLGEAPADVDPKVVRAVAFSVPCDLGASARRLGAPDARLYLARFLRSLKAKVRSKAARFPGRFPLDRLEESRDFIHFDEHFTAPMFGFAGAEDYYARASSAPARGAVRVPTLLVSARDDPFLTPECFPRGAAEANPHLTLEAPAHGGHVGFVDFGDPLGRYWSERRALQWLRAGSDSAREGD